MMLAILCSFAQTDNPAGMVVPIKNFDEDRAVAELMEELVEKRPFLKDFHISLWKVNPSPDFIQGYIPKLIDSPLLSEAL